MIGVISLFVCGCFVAVNSHSKSDGNEDKCLWNNEEFIRTSFARTCSQQLLVDVKHVVDSTSGRVNQIDNASQILQQELTDVREAVASSMSSVIRSQNGFQKILTEMKQVLHSCDNVDDELIANVSQMLQQMSEIHKKSTSELEHLIRQTFENFTEKILKTNEGLQGRMAEVAEAQERSTSSFANHLDALTQHLQQGFERTSTHQLLMQVKETVDNISAMQMTMHKSPESTPTCADVDEKQQLVSALTGKFVLPLT